MQQANKLPIDTQASIRELANKENLESWGNDIGSLTHAIVKDNEKDRQLHLIAITRRLLYCCPLPPTTNNNPMMEEEDEII